MVVSAGYTPSLLRTMRPSSSIHAADGTFTQPNSELIWWCRVDDAPVGRRGPVEPLAHSLGAPRVLGHADQFEPVRTDGFVQLLPDRQAEAAPSPR